MTSQIYNNNWLEGNYEGLAPQFIGLNNDKFKLHDIKLFASDNHDDAHLFPDYRTVFEKSELTYLCVQASFQNKMFNQQSLFSKKSWHAKMTMRCGRKVNSSWVDVCFFDMSREIAATENIVRLRNSWGMPERGAFWLPGEYYWDVWINDKLLVLQYFYVNDIGSVLYDMGRPYFKEAVFQFYDPFRNSNGKFFKTFNKQSTIDIGFNALLYPEQTKPFFGEFFFNGTYNEQSVLYYRSAAYYFDNIAEHPDDYFRHWVNINRFKEPGHWENGIYKFTLTFLNKIVFSASIEISDKDFIEGEFSSLGNYKKQVRGNENNHQPESAAGRENNINDSKTEADYLKEIDEFIGMANIKKSIHDHIKYLKFIQLRRQKGFNDNDALSLHSIFTGNPGTGKTTIIRMLGNIYRSMGLLSKGQVKEVDRADLIGEYIGQTALKTKRAIGEARGGILFIDEAYSLAKKGVVSDFGPEAIEILLKEMTSNTGDIAIMCAGYPKEMQDFLDSNPGLKSRFNHFYEFEDYTPDELLSICVFSANKHSVILPEQTRTVLLKELTKAYRDRSKNFGNARFANSIINEAKMNLAQRLMDHPDLNSLTNEQLSIIEPEDIEKIFYVQEKKHYELGIDEKLLQESLDDLNSLTGMPGIKQEVNELVKLIRFYIETNRDFLGKFSLHSVFTGNPGTGKTTVSRIMSRIYKALGMLERGHLVEVDRESLVAGYIGQTAIKTGEKINEAMGGILFIDEAYALVQKQGYSDFGNEAIQVILKRMEDLRGQFGVIVAGYTENMNEFIESNPGLKSRFDRVFHFNDYNPAEMFEIAAGILAKEKLYPDDKASGYLKNYFHHIYQTRDKHFGNARRVRQIVEEVIRKQNLRMASISPGDRSAEMMQTISIEDVTGVL